MRKLSHYSLFPLHLHFTVSQSIRNQFLTDLYQIAIMIIHDLVSVGEDEEG